MKGRTAGIMNHLLYGEIYCLTWAAHHAWLTTNMVVMPATTGRSSGCSSIDAIVMVGCRRREACCKNLGLGGVER
jgi:hypothetical protein